jgi:hypothetical protein
MWPVRRNGTTHGHHAVGVRTAVRPARLAGGLPVDEAFTTTTGAPRGGGRARWGDEILTETVGRWRGGCFRDGVPAIGSSSGGDGGGGDVLEHWEANRG